MHFVQADERFCSATLTFCGGCDGCVMWKQAKPDATATKKEAPPVVVPKSFEDTYELSNGVRMPVLGLGTMDLRKAKGQQVRACCLWAHVLWQGRGEEGGDVL